MDHAYYRNWRPSTVDEVTGQPHITETLKTQVASGRLSHAYLFTGTRGTGKTTCAKILSRAINCEAPENGNPCNRCRFCRGILDGSILDVLEIDAATNTGVDNIRNLREEAIYAPASVAKRVYIIDEVHMLSTGASNALLKILEEPPEHLVFILATTELHKVLPTVLSRCQRFSFKRILPEDIIRRLTYIALQEQLTLTPEGAALLARLADGGMRDALSLLDQCAVSGGEITRDRVLDALGLAGNLKTAHILDAVLQGRAAEAIERFDELYAAGKDVSAVLSELTALCRDLLIRRTAPAAAERLMTGGYDDATLNMLDNHATSERLVSILELLRQAAEHCKVSGSSRTVAEVCLIRISDPSLDGSSGGLAARIAALEAAVARGIPAAAPIAGQPREEQPSPAMKTSAEVPAPGKTAAKQAKKAAPIPAADGGNWQELLRRVSGDLPRWVYSRIKLPEVAQAVWTRDGLDIYTSDALDYNNTNRQDILNIFADAASAQLGTPVRVTLHRGKPPAKETPAGSFADLELYAKENNLT